MRSQKADTEMFTRNCSRCRKELTDPASREVGVGPVCRKLDNEILARQIPADAVSALALFESIDRAALPSEAHAAYDSVFDDLRMDVTRSDWRDAVRKIEWLLSWAVVRTVREKLIDTVDTLGYLGLAAVWRGEACKSRAMVFLDEPTARLFVVAKRNRAGKEALKAIRGRRFHRAAELGTDRGGWSVPAAQFGAFKRAVSRHYPLNDVEDWGRLETAASAAAAKATPATVTPCWSIKRHSATALLVRTPYKAEWVGQLKSLIPRRFRKWRKATKEWAVHARYEGVVRDLCIEYFGDGTEGMGAARESA